MEYLKIRNWSKWQTYRADRGQPPWIKIHRRIMRDPEWVSLTDAERGQLVAIWLLAADRDGAIPASPEIIQRLCFLDTIPNINKFTDLGFIENGWRHDGVTMASDSRQHDQPKAETKAEAEAEAEAEADKHHCPHKEIVKLWNDNMVPLGLGKILSWSDKRREHLRARWNEDPKRQNLDWWKGLFKYISQSDFLMGRVDPEPGHRRFFVSLDWLIKSSENLAKTIEGKYIDRD